MNKFLALIVAVSFTVIGCDSKTEAKKDEKKTEAKKEEPKKEERK